MYILLKLVILQCHASFQESISCSGKYFLIVSAAGWPCSRNWKLGQNGLGIWTCTQSATGELATAHDPKNPWRKTTNIPQKSQTWAKNNTMYHLYMMYFQTYCKKKQQRWENTWLRKGAGWTPTLHRSRPPHVLVTNNTAFLETRSLDKSFMMICLTFYQDLQGTTNFFASFVGKASFYRLVELWRHK